MINPVYIYTDGSCLGNQFKNACGGYGAVVQVNGETLELSQSYHDTSNNRMELRAVIASLKTVCTPSEIVIFSDSKYVTDAFGQGWINGWTARGWRKANGKPVENQDLWKELLELLHGHHVVWEWVKGHSDNAFNERADVLAKMATASDNPLCDVGHTAVNIVSIY
ncbi:ribonuclease HI [Maridesulfovibrio bastinii]|uniref:ribonuclease HI n=1 Tax=Maridesulfovibrio bastinii TaxID=47157 RepID=UPI000400741F|nr:ribonuclease HI [Maridesulfovibrio bastinii]